MEGAVVTPTCMFLYLLYHFFFPSWELDGEERLDVIRKAGRCLVVDYKLGGGF